MQARQANNALARWGAAGLILSSVSLAGDFPAAAPTNPQMNVSPIVVCSPFAGATELLVEVLVHQVLERNPSLTQMEAAWDAARARYPQATSLDDPMLAVTLGPATYGAQSVNGAYRINIEQKYPFPGKRRLRGQQANAEANAAGNDVDDVRLQLVESARSAFYEYYMVHRAIEVNEEGLRLLEEFRRNAETRYKTGLVPQQDVLQADVELGRQRERLLSLEQNREIAIARINTLMNLPPDSLLPPPPKEVRVENGLPDASGLRELALSRRPDLLALANRLAADQAALALANKEFYPDFTPFFMYDRFMGNTPSTETLAYQLGVSVNLPVRRDRRFAAVHEAQARLNERRASLERQVNQVKYEVQQAYAQVTQSGKTVRLYEQSVLPAAAANVKAAQTAYLTGKVPFLSLIEAERNLIGLRDRYYELVATYYVRLAALERAIGGPIEDALHLPPGRCPSSQSLSGTPNRAMPN
jgi:outer membrane protein TolC